MLVVTRYMRYMLVTTCNLVYTLDYITKELLMYIIIDGNNQVI